MVTRREFVKRAGLGGGLAAVGGMAVPPTAQAMKGKFDSPLALAHGGRAVLASGPEPGRAQAQAVAVTRYADGTYEPYSWSQAVVLV